MVFNFREGERESQIASILSEYDMTVMDYPRHYEGCPLLKMEMIHHFLRSSESWLSLGPHNVLLMHCERGGWPVLAFMLAALLIYRKQYTGEQKTLDMIYKQAPRELLQLLSPLDPVPSQLRYLQYVSRRNVASEWPPRDRALTLDCIMLRMIPNFDGEGGCRPIFRIYGQDPFIASDRTTKVLFSTQKKSKCVRHYRQTDCELVKIDIHCHIQGDVVLECISLDDDLEREEMMFRIMFNTAFIRSNILMVNRDQIDILWDAKYQFPKDFRAEVLLSEMDAASSVITMELTSGEEKEGLPIEAFAKVQEMFSNVDWLDVKGDAALHVLQQLTSSNSFQEKFDAVSPRKVQTHSMPRQPSPLKLTEKADYEEISNYAVSDVNMMPPSSVSYSNSAASGLSEPAEKNISIAWGGGNLWLLVVVVLRECCNLGPVFVRAILGLRSRCDEHQTENQKCMGWGKFVAVGGGGVEGMLQLGSCICPCNISMGWGKFVAVGGGGVEGMLQLGSCICPCNISMAWGKLVSVGGGGVEGMLQLGSSICPSNIRFEIKVLADKLPEVLDFDKDLVSLEAASKIQLKILAEEMQAISKGLEKVEQELTSSENDGPVSATFHKSLDVKLSIKAVSWKKIIPYSPGGTEFLKPSMNLTARGTVWKEFGFYRNSTLEESGRSSAFVEARLLEDSERSSASVEARLLEEFGRSLASMVAKGVRKKFGFRRSSVAGGVRKEFGFRKSSAG
ncbi:putative formin-like protein 6 [Cocos nucifera]|uniref:Putative formin-like protein 6 n=1 Tax=Cocos nucifera TaxID=13894 RepID=A0A8K0HU19_COCNU|nr:putative formin-like protein 6 [Cocos nucifera]